MARSPSRAGTKPNTMVRPRALECADVRMPASVSALIDGGLRTRTRPDRSPGAIHHPPCSQVTTRYGVHRTVRHPSVSKSPGPCRPRPPRSRRRAVPGRAGGGLLLQEQLEPGLPEIAPATRFLVTP